MSTTDTVPTYYPMSVDSYIGWVKEHPGREFEVKFDKDAAPEEQWRVRKPEWHRTTEEEMEEETAAAMARLPEWKRQAWDEVLATPAEFANFSVWELWHLTDRHPHRVRRYTEVAPPSEETDRVPRGVGSRTRRCGGSSDRAHSDGCRAGHRTPYGGGTSRNPAQDRTRSGSRRATGRHRQPDIHITE